MEDFVTFEIAKKLKEKGFNYKTIYSYNEEQIINPLVIEQYGELSDDGYYELTKEGGGDLEWSFVYIYNYELVKTDRIYVNRNTLSSPTISQVLKWLRKEKNIHIPIDFFVDIDTNEVCWYYSIKDIKNELNYISYVYSGKESYENSVLAGIEYVLDNLI